MLNKIIDLFPQKYIPYLKLMRVDKPIGALLLMWPCLWSIALASSFFPDYFLLMIFILGSFLMRAAGCIINDIIDIDIDKKVRRTMDRPLASGQITIKQAAKLLMLLLALSFLLLVSLNLTTIIIGIVSIIPIMIYPFMKRLTNFPQVFLGFVFNLGALMGSSAVTGKITFSSILLYIGCIFWTIGYDTIYGYQDKEDDLKIGVKSTSIFFASNTKKFLKIVYKSFAVLLMLACVFSNILGIVYLFLLPACYHLYWQIDKLQIDNPEDCLAKFKSNNILGLLVFIAIIASKLYSYILFTYHQ